MSDAHKLHKSYTLTAAAADFTTDWWFFERYRKGLLGIYLSAVSGTTPTLDIDVEWTPDPDAATVLVFDLGIAVTQLTAATTQPHPSYDITNLSSKWIRLAGTIGGTTPSFTGSLNFIAKT